ncbi:MAG: winged helix-turn-helix domain-containing protein [Nitrospira sp.]|nr:winged helix-turn-helix domain-containing protein [Nitrospira sp.]
MLPSLILIDRRLQHWAVLRTEPTLHRVLLMAVIPVGYPYSDDHFIEDLACGIDGVHFMEDGDRLLTATVGAYVRRRAGSVPSQKIYRVGAIELDGDRHEVRIAGQPVQLSAKPFAILEALMQSYPSVCRRDELLARVWGRGFAIGAHVIDVYVHVIRKLLDQFPEGDCHLMTVKKIGVRLVITSQQTPVHAAGSAPQSICATGSHAGHSPPGEVISRPNLLFHKLPSL